jgi:hypothetical protein
VNLKFALEFLILGKCQTNGEIVSERNARPPSKHLDIKPTGPGAQSATMALCSTLKDFSVANSITPLHEPNFSITSQEYGPLLSIIAFIIGILFIHITTAHAHITVPLRESLGHTIAMILSPITSGIASGHVTALFARRGVFCRRLPCFQYSISAGAIGIWIPHEFVHNLSTSHLGWRRVEYGTLVSMRGIIGRLQTKDTSHGRPVLFVIPRTSHVVDNRYNYLSPCSTSNKVAISLALIQLIWSTYTAYSQYAPLIRDRGLSSPFLIAIPFLYMNFLNLIANLVEGSYPYVTVLPPSNRHLPTPSRTITFHEWLEIKYPGIDFDEVPSLEVSSFIVHHLVSTIVIFAWIGMLTRFALGPDSSFCFILLAVFLDPILPAIVTIILRKFPPRSDIVQQVILGCERILCWSFFIGGSLVASSIYSGISCKFYLKLTILGA